MTESYQQHVEEVMPVSSNSTLNEMDTRRSFIWKIVVTVGWRRDSVLDWILGKNV